MKKLVALLLTVVMMSMFTAVGFADSEENGNQITVNGKALTSEEKKAVVADEKLFSRFGISPESLEVRNITDEEKIQYDITFDNGEINNLEIEKNEEGTVQMNVYEGEKHDTVSLTKDGTLVVNGNIVTINESSSGDITPRGRTSVYSKKPQKGKSADYTKYVKTYKNNNVNTKSKIKNLATGTIATIIAHALSATLPGSITIGALGTLASDLKSAAERYAPNSAYFSYAVKKYSYKKNTAIDKYYKHAGSYYVKKDCTGHSEKANFYEYNYIQ